MKTVTKVILFERVGDKHENFVTLIKHGHQAEVADALLGKLVRTDELEAFDLAEVRRVAEHVDEEELGDIAMAYCRVYNEWQTFRTASVIVPTDCLGRERRDECGRRTRKTASSTINESAGCKDGVHITHQDP